MLSPSEGQVDYALLTRSPLTSREQAPCLSVRLACVKHAASVRPEPGSNSPQKNFRTNPKQAVKSPKPNKRTNHHKPHKMQLMLASKKLLQRKNKQSPQPDGVKKRKPKKVNTITCQPIHLNAAETPNSIQKGTCSTYPTGTHQPTNH